MSDDSVPENDERRETDTERLRRLELWLVPGLGPRLWQNLLARFHSAEAVLNASLADLQNVDGVGPKLAAAIKTSRPEAAQREWDACLERGVNFLWQFDDGYPEPLSRIHDPPPMLYCRGELLPADALAVAIVGSRHCTLYGRQTAEKLAIALANAGLTVVSGLARGIDSSAHSGALQAGGRTLAVFATGLAEIYPPENAELANAISKQGALLSESPLKQAPLPGLFPQRNRIISGLSLGVIVIEASRKSGALHTARHAMEQNREVFAVPGRIDSDASLGCHDLIRDGATLIRDVDDVLNALGPLTKPVARSVNETVLSPAELLLSDHERAILNHVGLEAMAVDEIVRAAEMETSRVLTTLTVLEMRRLIRRLPGGFVVRATG
jgi:DNA processing protein